MRDPSTPSKITWSTSSLEESSLANTESVSDTISQDIRNNRGDFRQGYGPSMLSLHGGREDSFW
eukprot:Ihof_evm3s18 gene=Ihof_evmTU3s18